MDTENSENSENLAIYRCRLCLDPTSKKVDIFRHDFPKMIEILSGLKPDPNDNLPKESCLECAKDVKFCMSIRKQILHSHRTLTNKLRANEDLQTNYSTNVKHKDKHSPKKRARKREMTPDSTSEEDNYYSDSQEYQEEENVSESEANEDIEEITIIHDVEPKAEDISENVEVQQPEPELKTEEENNENTTTKEPTTNPPLSPKRLLRKRNMIVMSNRILKQENSVGDRRYPSVVFIRKSMRDKLKKKDASDKPKRQTEKLDNEKIIWKNGKKYLACEICKKEVKQHYMKHHMTIHFPEHFSCDVCGVMTRNLRGLRYHKLYWHSSKLDYICDKCGKKYRSKHALDLHNKKEHGGVRDLECDICGKKFFQKMHLKRHVDGIHKKLRPHKCEYCGKDFTKRTHLVTHWRTHTNETPYGCDMCGERFKLKLSLKNHMRRAHNVEEKERVFCDVCNRGFATEQGLRAHINSRVHEGEKCQYCSETFTPEFLKVHLRDVHLHVDFY